MAPKRGIALKRIIDIVLSIVLILLLFPLFILIIVIIQAESPGPALFKHERVGHNGKNFEMWKFRTMVNGADKKGSGLTQHNDTRITRFGSLLRRFSLDEMPQLINVLTGEMSIVGPRPEIPEIVESYSVEQQKALEVKPGITGLSQINGRDDLPIEKKLRYEVDYVNNRSIVLDLKIMIKTIPAVVNARGNRF